MKRSAVFLNIAKIVLCMVAAGIVCSCDVGGSTSTYSVTFSINEGLGSAPAEKKVNSGSSITLPNGSGFSRSSHIFGGWNTKSDGTGTNYSAGSSFFPSGDTTLYAKWDQTGQGIQYTVTYNINGGSGTAPSAQTANAGSIILLPGGNTFSRSGYTFSGWNTIADGSGTSYSAGSSFTPAGDTTLYARWNRNSSGGGDGAFYRVYYITFNINDGYGTTPGRQSVSYLEPSITLPDDSEFSRSGYTFGGWNTMPDGTGTNYDAGFSYTPTFDSSSDIILYARWVVAVTFNINGGIGTTPNAQTLEDDSGITLPSGDGITRSGYIFGGWNINASGTGTNYPAGYLFTTDYSITLYARWIVGDYRLGDFTFVGDTTYTIIGYSGSGGVIIIPAEANGKPVVAIDNRSSEANGVFNNKRITGATIPDSIITIGDYAFSNNTLTSVNIPDSVTTIGSGAFSNNRLTNVSFGNSVSSIGERAFYSNRLSSVTIPAEVTSIDDYTFYDNQLTDLTIPDNVISIGASAFRNNLLVNVSTGNGVSTIGNYAFAGNRLTNVSFGNSVASIGARAFDSNRLASISIPDSVTTLEEYAFNNNLMTSVTFNNSAAAIGNNAFYNNQLTSVDLGGVISIGANAFYGNRLVSINIPDSVTTIGNYAFSNNQLTSVIIGDGILIIGDYIFANNLLTSVTFSENVTSIGVRAFEGNRLVSVTIPDSVKSIAVGAFYSNQLTSIKIGANVTLGSYSFDSSFDNYYDYGGYSKAAGTYTRPSTSSTTWTKLPD